MSLGSLLGLVGVVVLLLWLARRHEAVSHSPRRPRHADIDYDILEDAERQVRDVDAGANPEEGFVGDDWGPGAPHT